MHRESLPFHLIKSYIVKMHSGLFAFLLAVCIYFRSRSELPGLSCVCLANINNKPVKTFYLKIEKLLNLKQERHATRHQTPDQRRTG